MTLRQNSSHESVHKTQEEKSLCRRSTVARDSALCTQLCIQNMELVFHGPSFCEVYLRRLCRRQLYCLLSLARASDGPSPEMSRRNRPKAEIGAVGLMIRSQEMVALNTALCSPSPAAGLSARLQLAPPGSHQGCRECVEEIAIAPAGCIQYGLWALGCKPLGGAPVAFLSCKLRRECL